MLQFLENIKDKEENINITKDIIENDVLYKMPLEKKIIESYIFDIKKFEIDKNLEGNNASILLKISGEKIDIVNDSKITIYNHRFLIDIVIDVSLFKNKKQKIENLFVHVKKEIYSNLK